MIKYNNGSDIQVIKCCECQEESWAEFAWEREDGSVVCAECMSVRDRVGCEKAKEIVYGTK